MRSKRSLTVRWVLIYIGVATYFGVAITAASIIASSSDSCLEEVADVCLKYEAGAEDALEIATSSQTAHHVEAGAGTRGADFVETRLSQRGPLPPFFGLKF